jgi:tripartite-type tricarboxylate transporter receptor subunit TctC
MKNLLRRRLSMAIATALLSMASPTLALASEKFPSRAVTFVVPYAPGGPADVFTRALSQELEKLWRVPVVVDNKPGAAEVVGAQRVIASAPDGHTVFVGGALAFTLNRLTFDKLPYDPDKLLPISRLVHFNLALVVRGDTAAANLNEFVALSRRGQRLHFGSAGGQGGQVHMAYLDLTHDTGMALDFIPYNGLAPVMQDLLGGRVDTTLAGVAPSRPHLESGRMRALAVGGSARSKLMPDVPTFRELGYPNVNASFYSALAVPAGTPAGVVDRLVLDVRAVLQSPEFAQRHLEPAAAELVADSPAEFAAYLARERTHLAARLQSAQRARP